MAMGVIEIPETHGGPRGIGHGGYVVGLLSTNIRGAAQVTLRKPAPLGVPLDIVLTEHGWELRNGDDVIAEATSAKLELDVPAPPSVDAARAAQDKSPSRWHERGVHPTCFGCAQFRDDDIGLGIGVGPVHVDGVDLVAATWRPRAEHADADGVVDPHIVVAAIDCPGAMAFIAYEQGAGLLGRMVVEQFGPVVAGTDYIVMAWQIGTDGRKLFAGTALTTADGEVLAASRQTWFPMNRG